MRKTNKALTGDGHLEKKPKGKLSTVLLETQTTSSPKAAGAYYNKWDHNKRPTVSPHLQELLTPLWICFV